MEVENTTHSKKKASGFFTFLLGLLSVVILFGTLGGVAYYYLVLKQDQGNAPINPDQIASLNAQIVLKDGQIKLLKDENSLLKKQIKQEVGVIQRLSYVIKPKAQWIAECSVARIGKWQIPQGCLQRAQASIKGLLNSDKRIVAFEVIGIVDEKPYGGRSPKLKQEGLASLRARGVIEELHQMFPNTVFFEGLSQQKDQKRGFLIRAYYVQ